MLLGILGGIGMIVGPIGLFVLQRRRDIGLARPAARAAWTPRSSLMLVLTSITGFALLMLRDTAAMGMLLAVHLGVVLGLFLSMPYGKFVHGLYRFLALIKYASERRAWHVCGVGNCIDRARNPAQSWVRAGGPRVGA